jgi:hypothetical protein
VCVLCHLRSFMMHCIETCYFCSIAPLPDYTPVRSQSTVSCCETRTSRQVPQPDRMRGTPPVPPSFLPSSVPLSCCDCTVGRLSNKPHGNFDVAHPLYISVLSGAERRTTQSEKPL